VSAPTVALRFTLLAAFGIVCKLLFVKEKLLPNGEWQEREFGVYHCYQADIE
jgi:hypothetical protein